MNLLNKQLVAIKKLTRFILVKRKSEINCFKAFGF